MVVGMGRRRNGRGRDTSFLYSPVQSSPFSAIRVRTGAASERARGEEWKIRPGDSRCQGSKPGVLGGSQSNGIEIDN